ncbi:MAG: hypothetical protein ACYTA3_04315 [Planctomycetota bacterium]
MSIFALVGALSLAALTPGLGQEGHEFMPKGGKTLLIELLGTPLDAARLREITQGQHGEEEWSDALAGQTSAMSEQQRRTISAYLAVNMPLPEGALEKAESLGDATAALPPDGRELDAGPRRPGVAKHVRVAVPSRDQDERTAARNIRALLGHQHAHARRGRAGGAAVLEFQRRRNMMIFRFQIGVFAALAAMVLAGSLHAQGEDVFAFIPPGGKTLLAVVARAAPANELQDILTGRHTRAEWEVYLKERTGAIAALGDLDEIGLATLADYLAFNMPLPEGSVPADPGKADWIAVLPPDGRDLTLENCQFCHIITVVVTQDKTQDAWLGTMNKPSHIEIKITPEQRQALASYLVLNAAIPIDLVPEELRAGGASY